MMDVSPFLLAQIKANCREALKNPSSWYMVLDNLDVQRMERLGITIHDLFSTLETGVPTAPQLYFDGNLEWTFLPSEGVKVKVVLDEKKRDLIITDFFV